MQYWYILCLQSFPAAQHDVIDKRWA